MIAFIQGQLAEKWDKVCIVLTSSGVGYRVLLPEHTFNQLPEKGEEVAFYTSLAVREDALELFGFATFAERQAFEILRAVSRIGSRTAQAILARYRPDDLAQIIAQDNLAALTAVPGIGQKTAQYLLLELKSKIKPLAANSQQVGKAALPTLYGDLVAALANLGYGEDECAGIAREIVKSEPDLDVGSAIRKALKELAKSR